MIFEFIVHRPGISGYQRKTNEPIPFEPEISQFEAACNTEAELIAERLYKQTGLGSVGYYNISKT